MEMHVENINTMTIANTILYTSQILLTVVIDIHNTFICEDFVNVNFPDCPLRKGYINQLSNNILYT